MSAIDDIDEDDAPSSDADVIEQADFVLKYEPRSGLLAAGFEWDTLVEELRDEVVRLRAALAKLEAGG